jgi:glutathione S-transferase
MDSVARAFQQSTSARTIRFQSQAIDPIAARDNYAVQNMAYFDSVLTRQRFLDGETFSMPDITLYAGLLFADMVGLPVATELRALTAWRDRVSEIPSVKNRSGRSALPMDIARMGG